MDWMLKLGALYALHCGDEEMKGSALHRKQTLNRAC
jgi:hypothetical protein